MRRSASHKLILVRGVPGSGKSTYARSLGIFHVEADDFFTDEQGVFTYQVERLKDAHEWCYQQARSVLLRGESVVVANTFVTVFEMQRYLNFVRANRIPVDIVVMTGNYGSTRGVPQEKIEQMRRRWETYEHR